LDFLGEAFFDDWGGGRFAPVYEIRVQLFKRGPVTVFWAGNDCRHPGRRQNKTIEGFISSIIRIYISLIICIYIYIEVSCFFVFLFIYIYVCVCLCVWCVCVL
jgi:hypothetical protein